MRTVDSSITSNENGAALKPETALISSNELLSFAPFTTQGGSSLDVSIPQNYSGAAVTWHDNTGTAYYRAFTPGTAAHWGLDPYSPGGGIKLDGVGAAPQYHAMRYWPVGPIVPRHDGSGIRIYSTPGGATFGPLFGPAFVDGASKVVRVEAVCAVADAATSVIVAVGTHDFVLHLSTVEFWIVTSGAAIQLDTIIQCTLSDTYTTWSGCAKWACFISAIYDSANLAIRVIANAHPLGKSVTFSIKNGVESIVRPVVPVDPAYGSIMFRASSVTQIGALFYLCGRLTYTFADGSTQAFDCYLTSTDGDSWSIGERSFYLHATDSMGTLLLDTSPTPDVIYYGGNLVASVAVGTPAQGVNAASMQIAPAMMPGGSMTQVSNGADGLSFDVANATGAYTDNPLLTRGSVIYLSKGQWSVLSQVGVFSVDSVTNTVTAAGRLAAKVKARDIASKAIIRHNVPTDAEFNGQDALVTALADKSGLVVLTRDTDILVQDSTNPTGSNVNDYDAIMGSTGLLHKGLNNPLVALADVQEAPDCFLRATVAFPDTGDTYALPAFAFLFNAEDDGEFRGVIIPKANTWGSKTKPRVVASNIKPYASATDTGGFKFVSRMQGLWASNNVGTDAYLQAVSEVASHYASEPAYTHAAGLTQDYVCRVSGRRVQLWAKPHDFNPATMAGNAVFALQSEYLYTADARLTPDHKSRPGFAVNTDVPASTAWSRGVVGGNDAQLTAAGEYATYGVICGFDGGQNDAGLQRHVHITTGGLTFAVNEVLLMTFSGTPQPVTVTAWNSGTARLDVKQLSGFTFSPTPGSGNVWAAQNADTWGYADTSYKTYAVTGGSVQADPRAPKLPLLVGGKAAYSTDDDTAMVVREIETDFQHDVLYNGNVAAQQGWDATTPVTTPQSWRRVFRPGRIAATSPATAGLRDAGGFLMYKHEVINYIKKTFSKLGHGNGATFDWTIVPTYYSALKAQAAGGTTLTQETNGSTTPADDWTLISSETSAKMLVEITSRNGGAAQTIQRYVNSVAAAGGGLGGVATLDTAIETEVRGIATRGATAGDFSILSGRGQFGTTKQDYSADAPAMCVYPATSLVSSFVTVSRFQAYTGVKRSVEDALRYLCNLAGARGAAFRNLLASAYVKTPYVYSITATPTAIPTVSSKTYADFVLDMDAHIDTTNRLYVDFRNYYRLTLKQVGAAGAIEVGLQAPNDVGITASGGFRWLQYASVNVNNGVTLCAAAADNAHVRLSVIGDNIAVEINGKHIWTFDLGEMVHTDGTSYKRLTVGSILLSYASAVAGNSASIRLLELWAEHKALALPMGTSTSTAIKRICDKWGIRSRATQSGGLEFGTFTSRDNGGTLQKSLIQHVHTGDDGHDVTAVMVTGKQSGMYVDAAHMAAEGFAFKTSSNSDATTVQESAEAAQLVTRESVEFAQQESVNATMHAAHEVEDSVILTYAPAADAPSFNVGSSAILLEDGTEVLLENGTALLLEVDASSASYVVTAVTWQFGEKMDTASYTLRENILWA